jgi:transcriptional regulator with XRE-family HTH domain
MIRQTILDELARQGLSQAELARRLGLPQQNLNRALQPGHDPRLSLIERICQALRLTLTPTPQPTRRRPK